MKDTIPIESETIKRLSKEDVELITDVYYSLSDFIALTPNFYITVFKNKENRKIVLKICGCLLKQALIEKIDITEN